MSRIFFIGIMVVSFLILSALLIITSSVNAVEDALVSYPEAELTDLAFTPTPGQTWITLGTWVSTVPAFAMHCTEDGKECWAVVTVEATALVEVPTQVTPEPAKVHRERICLADDDCYEGVNLPDTGEPEAWTLCPDGADCLQKGEVKVWGVRAHLGEHILDQVYSCDRNMKNCVEVLPNEDGLFCFDDGSCVFPLETEIPHP